VPIATPSASLVRDPDEAAPHTERPEPQQKRLGASLPQDPDGELISATDATFASVA